MTKNKMTKLFKDLSDEEFLKFERIQKPKSQRPDIAAFLLLDELVPGKRDMVSAAEHDEFFLDVDLDELARVITEDQITYLVRCGVCVGGCDCLCMFA